jgi:hypothetical protein
VPFRRFVLPGCALLVVLTFVTLTRADPDLWGHVRFGGDIIDSGTIGQADTYSFTSDKPWINHEWLSEILMAAAFRTAGASGLVLLKLAIILLSLTCVWRIAKGDGADARTAVVLTALGLVGILTRSQQVRPQLFSVLCFSVLVLLLRRAERRQLALWLLPPLMVFWANTHGGWLVGCGTLGLWCAANTWTAWRRAELTARSLVTMWAACIAAVAATLVNPYGIGLWRFLASTVGPSRRFIAEWGPVYTDIALLGPWCVFALIAAVAIRRADRSTRLHAVVIPLFWGLVGFKVSRLDAFFALSTVGLLAPEIIRMIQERRRAERTGRQSLVAQGMVAVVALAILTLTIPQLKTNLLCIDVHAASTVPEVEAMTFIREQQLAGKMVTFFDWGQYAIWHKPSDLRVSMDGRRETVYTERTVDLHLDMYLALQDGLSYLESLHADYIWLPRDLPVTAVLSQSAMWSPIYRSSGSIIFARRELARAGGVVQEGSNARCRCFPGP